MKDWISRAVIFSLLTIIVGVPLALRPAAAKREIASSDDANRLVILTPHNEQIRYEIALAFNRWRVSQGRPAIDFDWRSSGGTSDLAKQVRTEFQKAAEHGEEDRGIGKDLFFGGGDFEHDRLARGILVKRGGKDVKVPLTVPLDLPPELVKAAFPQPSLAGVPLYHPEMRWVGVVLSSFGIIYNKDTLAMLGLEAPRTWSDLAAVRYRGWVALADPSHSGSIAAAYNVILRRLGWADGWFTLRRVFANARYFTASAQKVPVDVSAGEAAAGMCIDFFGRFQVGAIGEDRVGYVDPPFMTAVTPDPVAMLRGAPHKALATQFVAWLLSPETQALWQRRKGDAGAPRAPGFPDQFELRRLPIRSDAYEPEAMSQWIDRVNPFATTAPLPPGMPEFYLAVAPIVQAMAIDTNDELRVAWGAIIAHPDHPQRGEMIRLFDSMPPELTLVWPDADLESQWRDAMEDPNHPRRAEVVAVLRKFIDDLAARYNGWKNTEKVLEDRLRWTRFFKGNYTKVAAVLGGDPKAAGNSD